MQKLRDRQTDRRTYEIERRERTGARASDVTGLSARDWLSRPRGCRPLEREWFRGDPALFTHLRINS